MVADYNFQLGITTVMEYESGWEESGPAIIQALESGEYNENASVDLTLYYPKKGRSYRFHYELVRDTARGDQRFGYWIFKSGKIIY